MSVESENKTSIEESQDQKKVIINQTVETLKEIIQKMGLEPYINNFTDSLGLKPKKYPAILDMAWKFRNFEQIASRSTRITSPEIFPEEKVPDISIEENQEKVVADEIPVKNSFVEVEESAMSLEPYIIDHFENPFRYKPKPKKYYHGTLELSPSSMINSRGIILARRDKSFQDNYGGSIISMIQEENKEYSEKEPVFNKVSTEIIEISNELPNGKKIKTEILFNEENFPALSSKLYIEMSRIPEEIPFSLMKRVKNPYTLLHRDICLKVAAYENVCINNDVVAELFNHDQNFPEWKNEIMNSDIFTLERPELYYYAARLGIIIPQGPVHNSIRFIRDYISLVMHWSGLERITLCKENFILGRTNEQILDVFLSTINTDKLTLLWYNTNQKIKLFLDREINYIDHRYDHQQERFKELNKITYSKVLSSLYDTTSILNILNYKKHPYEDILSPLHPSKTLDNPNEIAEKIGMQIPFDIKTKEQKYGYLINNFQDYIPSDKPILSDKELFEKYNAIVDYDNRQNLENNLDTLVTYKLFFYPIKRNLHSINNDTFVELNDIMDKDVFIIAYGTCSSYHCYDMIDLISAFQETAKGIAFRHPENYDKEFFDVDIENLRKLLLFLLAKIEIDGHPDLYKILELMNQIEITKSTLREFTDYDREIKTKLVNSSNHQVYGNVKTILLNIFYAGMYMRRWKGPGHEYPIRTNDTNGVDLPDVEVSQYLVKIKNQIKSLPKEIRKIIRTLKIVHYENNSLTQSSEIFSTYFHSVCNGNQCIRQASSRFIGTSVHYLFTLFNHKIPNFNKYDLDEIY